MPHFMLKVPLGKQKQMLFTSITRIHWDQEPTRSTITSLLCLGGLVWDLTQSPPGGVYMLTDSPVTPSKKAAGGQKI